MKPETKSLLIKYAICTGIASLITVGVFAIKGFFTDSISVNIQILSDGFFISGMMLLFVAGMLYINGEGGLLGISFVLKSVVQIFIPGGRKNHEVYAKYRERKIQEIKKNNDRCVLVVGLLFFAVGVIFTVIWYTAFYTAP